MTWSEKLAHAAAEAARRFPTDRIAAVAFIRDKTNADARTALRALDDMIAQAEAGVRVQRMEQSR